MFEAYGFPVKILGILLVHVDKHNIHVISSLSSTWILFCSPWKYVLYKNDKLRQMYEMYDA